MAHGIQPGDAGEPAPLTVVVADDSPGILELLAQVLRTAAARVVTAGDGEAALRAIRAHRPAVAVLDAEMPLRSGPEVAALVRADPALASTRILLVSGHIPGDAARGAPAMGIDAWLAKPFRPQELLAAVRALAATSTSFRES